MSGPLSPESRARIRELAWVFLKLGTIGFGGPAAHIALMEREVVHRRGWISRSEFLDLLAATNLIPGPNSTEMAIHIGHRRAGTAGLVVAGACFILPATLIVAGMAWFYVRFGAYPMASVALYAIKPVILAIVVLALWSLGRSSMRSGWLALLGAAALFANLMGVGELTVLVLTGVVAGVVHLSRRKPPMGTAALGSALPQWMIGLAALGSMAGSPAAYSAWEMFVVFLKIGSVLFGSGYVLLAFLRGDFVERLGWLTEGQLLDAVAVGQFTPGPVFTTATFIGYLLGGFSGAALATFAIFLPAFVFVAISGPLVPRLRRSALASAVLDGLVVASLAVMGSVTLTLARVAIIDWPTAGLAMVAAFLPLRFKINSAWLVIGAGTLGMILASVRP